MFFFSELGIPKCLVGRAISHKCNHETFLIEKKYGFKSYLTDNF